MLRLPVFPCWALSPSLLGPWRFSALWLGAVVWGGGFSVVSWESGVSQARGEGRACGAVAEWVRLMAWVGFGILRRIQAMLCLSAPLCPVFGPSLRRLSALPCPTGRGGGGGGSGAVGGRGVRGAPFVIGGSSVPGPARVAAGLSFRAEPGLVYRIGDSAVAIRWQCLLGWSDDAFFRSPALLRPTVS